MGHSTPLHRYLEDVEELCADRGDESDATRIKKTLWYVDYRFHNAWESILDENKTWAENKIALLNNFPGLDSLYKYSLNDLLKLVQKFLTKAMETQETLAEYHCEFMVLASYLEKEKLASRDELNRKYVLGLPTSFRTKVLNQLTEEDPKHTPGLGHDYLQVNRAARYVLQDNIYNGYGLEEKPRVTFKMEDEPIHALPRFQKEMADELASIKAFMNEQSRNNFSNNQMQGGINYTMTNNQQGGY